MAAEKLPRHVVLASGCSAKAIYMTDTGCYMGAISWPLLSSLCRMLITYQIRWTWGSLYDWGVQVCGGSFGARWRLAGSRF